MENVRNDELKQSFEKENDLLDKYFSENIDLVDRYFSLKKEQRIGRMSFFIRTTIKWVISGFCSGLLSNLVGLGIILALA